jgi:uncharacterized membrane protein YfcA
MQTALAFLLSAALGASLGLLGGGGSILAVPMLVYVAGAEPRAAIGMSLAIVGMTSFFAGLLHARAGNVAIRQAALFGVLGVGTSYWGARATRGARPELLLFLFGVVMLAAGLAMLARRRAEEITRPRPPRLLALVPVAIGLGVLTGALGVGGGFLVVPALVLFGGLPMRLAVGTSLFVIATNSAAGFVAHLSDHDLDLARTAAFNAAALAGAIGGQKLAGRFSPVALRTAFGGTASSAASISPTTTRSSSPTRSRWSSSS